MSDWVDIHHHCLPGVDDGPTTLEEALALCRAAWDEGIGTIVATPHVLRGLWPEPDRSTLETLRNDLAARLGSQPRILPGSECYFTHDLVERMEGPEHVIPLGEGRYVLIELASHNIPPMIESVFFRLQMAGWVPLIAHPERNTVLQSKPEILESLIEKGARVQITSASLTGEFGDRCRRTAEQWTDREMVHVVATDAHNLAKRPPAMRKAFEKVTKRWGAPRAEALFRDNPSAIAEGRTLPYDPEPADGKRRGLLSGFLRRRER